MIMSILALVVLIAASAFFSGSETALMSVSNIKVRALLKQKKKNADILYRVKTHPRRLLITILIGNNLVNIAAASIAVVVFTKLFGSTAVGISTGVMTILVLTFGEVIPKTFSTQDAERIALIVARPVEILYWLFLPLVLFFEAISKFMTKAFGVKSVKKLSEEEIKTVVTMGLEEGLLSQGAAEMMKNILKFEKTKVVEIMTPKTDVKMVDGNKRIKDVLNFVVKTPYSRYPVFLGKEDNIIGVLDIDDVLEYMKKGKTNIKVKTISRDVLFVPEAKEIDDLLIEIAGREVQMAIVVDEYSIVSGIVTVEDILEEIVGEIFDKSHSVNLFIKRINANTAKVDARVSVDDVNEVLNLGLEAGQFNTLAGLIEHKLQRIPKKGERIKLKNITIIIDKVTKRGISSVKIIKP